MLKRAFLKVVFHAEHDGYVQFLIWGLNNKWKKKKWNFPECKMATPCEEEAMEVEQNPGESPKMNKDI